MLKPVETLSVDHRVRWPGQTRPTGASMQLSPSPDLRSSRRLVATAAIATLCVLAMLVWQVHRIAGALGDTDDAMRLVMVRDLLAGRGWYDQVIWRLQPPHGVLLHWSRLVDGGIAALM